MADTATSSSGQRVVGINTLSIEELSALQRQLDGDLNFFNSSLSELKTVATKFGRCQATVESMNPDERDKEALIPLSESVYINAKIPNPNEYLVEIGTGYFVEMNREQARDYFNRKYTFVEGQLETISRKILPEKQQTRQVIVAALQKKIEEASAFNNSSSS